MLLKMKKTIYFLAMACALMATLAIYFYLTPSYQASTKPDESRFSKIVLADSLAEPMELALMSNGNVLFAERNGKIKLYDSKADKIKTIAELNVFYKFNDGILGMTLDPDFDKNGWVYIYYSPNDTLPRNKVARFLMVSKDSLLLASEKTIIEVPVQRQSCCHAGGSLAFDKDGLLYIATGDNVSSFESDGFSPSDERPNRSPFDAQGSSANTQDLRGKILRIRPMPDGKYTIPRGNLFAPDSKKGRPEIYVMGCRNPFRISIDDRKNLLYWGDVGPDSGKDSLQGPRGYDEINQTNKAGFFGWPYFVGNNKPYRKYDFEQKTAGAYYDPQRPINRSPNNTGDTLLPPAQPAFIWYPYSESKEFPFVGKGGRNAMAGPTYYYNDYKSSTIKLPDYYDGKIFIYDWMRDWIFALTLDKNNALKNAERFAPKLKFDHIIDMEMGTDGAMYLLEYGQTWYANNADARLVRIEYTNGNRAPLAKIETDKTAGKLPLTVTFSAKNSIDYDLNETLSYQWFVGEKPFAKDRDTKYIFSKAGVYTVRLQVTDKQGKSAEQAIEIVAGNEPPRISIDLKGNQSFYFDDTKIPYQVKIDDEEQTDMNENKLKIQYSYQSFEMSQGKQQDGVALIEKNNCKACHAFDKKSLAPAYIQIAQRYNDDENTIKMLINKIRNGGKGNWESEQAMSAFPDLPENEIRTMVKYILSLNKGKMPTMGEINFSQHGKNEKGKYIFSVNYTDKGTKETKPLLSQKQIVWQYPQLEAEYADQIQKGQIRNIHQPISYRFVLGLNNQSWLMHKNIDLEGIKSIKVRLSCATKGYRLSVRQGNPNGQEVGKISLPAMESDGGWDIKNWTEVNIPIIPNSIGISHLYFVFDNPNQEEKQGCAIDWVRFEK
jgi:cytochrome c